MTRAETLVRQLADLTLAPITIELSRIQRTAPPPLPATAKVRACWREYQRANKRLQALQAQLVAAGAHTYSGNGRLRMKEDTKARNAAVAKLTAKQAKIRALKQAAMLGVLGLDAAKARPIVLKLKRDLEKVVKG